MTATANGPDRKTLLMWAEQVMTAMWTRVDAERTRASHVEDDDHPVDDRSGDADPLDVRDTCRRGASAVLYSSDGGASARRDVRVMTLVWKNLTKLATTRGAALLAATEKQDPSPAPSISIANVYDALLGSVASSSQVLRGRGGGRLGEGAAPLKPLRVFLRALQGHFLALAESLAAQVETTLVVLVDVVAALLPLTDSHDAQRQTQLVVAWIESLATTPRSCSARRSSSPPRSSRSRSTRSSRW
ncbi:hypothetical protein PINS_up019685 [Pythium insidiosum]|nr:hypothetical protein PINS_up019685 [Pythium insidiosum]